MPDTYICGRLLRTKITHKASDTAEYIELLVLSPEIVMHDDTYFSGRSGNNIKCVVHDYLE